MISNYTPTRVLSRRQILADINREKRRVKSYRRRVNRINAPYKRREIDSSPLILVATFIIVTIALLPYVDNIYRLANALIAYDMNANVYTIRGNTSSFPPLISPQQQVSPTPAPLESVQAIAPPNTPLPPVVAPPAEFVPAFKNDAWIVSGGRGLVYLGEGNTIVYVDIATQEFRTIPHDSTFEPVMLRPSPDGTKIAWLEQKTLHRFDLAAEQDQVIAPNVERYEWLPDGGFILATEAQAGTTQLASRDSNYQFTWTINVASRNIRSLVVSSRGEVAYLIAGEIFVMSPNQAAPRRLAARAEVLHNLVWSVNGTFLSVERFIQPTANQQSRIIDVYDVASGQLQTYGDMNAVNGKVTWLTTDPDELVYAYSLDSGRDAGIWSLNVRTGMRRAIVSDAASITTIRWLNGNLLYQAYDSFYTINYQQPGIAICLTGRSCG